MKNLIEMLNQLKKQSVEIDNDFNAYLADHASANVVQGDIEVIKYLSSTIYDFLSEKGMLK